MICDSWQWIPFIFICMLAALSVPRDHVEAAEVTALKHPDFPRSDVAADRAVCRHRAPDPA
jgi:hypothetical protein